MPFPYWDKISDRVCWYPIYEDEDLDINKITENDIVERLIEDEYGLRATGQVNTPEGQKEWDIWEETYDYEVVDHLKFHRDFAWFVLTFKED